MVHYTINDITETTDRFGPVQRAVIELFGEDDYPDNTERILDKKLILDISKLVRMKVHEQYKKNRIQDAEVG